MKKYYDFHGGFQGVSRMFAAWKIRSLAKRKLTFQKTLFTDGCGYIDQQIFADGLFERGLIEIILDITKQNKHRALYVDIGANIGNHLVGVADQFDHAIAFDPHPVLFHVLTANVMANNLKNVELFNVGIANENASGVLIESHENHGLSRVDERSKLSAETFGMKEEQFGRRHQIKLVSAAEVFEKYTASLNQAFIKIDVEGMEAEILSTLLPYLEKYKPIVGFEWFQNEQPEIVELLSKLSGYKLYGASIEQPKNGMIRFFKNVFFGRRYELREVPVKNEGKFYPLAFLVPENN